MFKNKFSKNCKSSKSCSSLPFGPTPDLSNLLQQSGAGYLENELPSRLVVCKTRFYLFCFRQTFSFEVTFAFGKMYFSVKNGFQRANCYHIQELCALFIKIDPCYQNFFCSFQDQSTFLEDFRASFEKMLQNKVQTKLVTKGGSCGDQKC